MTRTDPHIDDPYWVSDPYWIRSYPHDVCVTCTVPVLERGKRVLYWPYDDKLQCELCGEFEFARAGQGETRPPRRLLLGLR